MCTWLSESKAQEFIFIDSTAGEGKVHKEKHPSIYSSVCKKQKSSFPMKLLLFFLLLSTTFPLMPYYMPRYTDKINDLKVRTQWQPLLCTVQICTDSIPQFS